MHKKSDQISPALIDDVSRRAITRRELLKLSGAILALLVSPSGHAATSLVAIRIWPSEEYTRITLESATELKYKYLLLTDPDRLVVDLEEVELNSVLQMLSSKVLDSDPYISLIRAGQNRPGVVRVVVELKQVIKPQIFILKPVGNYGYRLVLDLYPIQPIDPLLALIEKPSSEEAAAGEGDSDASSPELPPTTADSSSAPKDTKRSSPPPAKRLLTIAIDPGHGGEDPGAVGRRGTYEKNITLSIARLLKRKIDAQPDMRSVLTRDGDYFVPLYQRVTKARQIKADLFVSIHADAFIRPDARGSSVFVLSEHGASSSAARWLATKENDADLIGGINLSKQDGHLARTLLDLSQTATINDSLKLGKVVLSELGELNVLHKAQVEQAGFAVLKAPDIPSILVETAFISNPEEERRLNDKTYQNKLAEAILRGIRRYFKDHPPPIRHQVALTK